MLKQVRAAASIVVRGTWRSVTPVLQQNACSLIWTSRCPFAAVPPFTPPLLHVPICWTLQVLLEGLSAREYAWQWVVPRLLCCLSLLVLFSKIPLPVPVHLYHSATFGRQQCVQASRWPLALFTCVGAGLESAVINALMLPAPPLRSGSSRHL